MNGSSPKAFSLYFTIMTIIDLELTYMEYTTILWEYQKVKFDYEAGLVDVQDVYDVLERLKSQERKSYHRTLLYSLLSQLYDRK